MATATSAPVSTFHNGNNGLLENNLGKFIDSLLNRFGDCHC